MYLSEVQSITCVMKGAAVKTGEMLVPYTAYSYTMANVYLKRGCITKSVMSFLSSNSLKIATNLAVIWQNWKGNCRFV